MLRSCFPMTKMAKDLHIIVSVVSVIIILAFCMSLILFSWQFFYSVNAQDDDDEVEEDIDTTDANNRHDNDDRSFIVIIPENAAWNHQ